MRNYGVVRLDSLVTAATVAAGYQPLDSDLTAIAALATTSYGRALLGLADQAALVALLPSYQPLDSDLTAIAALTTTTFGRALLTLADAAALRTAAGLAAIAASGSATDLTAGTVPTARLGSGSASSSTYLRGDQTWATVSGGGGGLVVGDITGATDISTGLTSDDVIPLANDPAGTPALRKATLTRVTEQVGGLLAYKKHTQSGNYTTTSATLADVDAANLVVTFTAPPSGKVLIRLSCCCSGGAGSVGLFWNLRDSGGDVTGTKSFAHSNTAANGVRSVPIIKTGLTPGTSYTYKWGYASGSGGVTVFLFGSTSTGSDDGFTMEVWSIPQ